MFIVVAALSLCPERARAWDFVGHQALVRPRPVPILMYHEVGDGPNQLYVRTSDFEAQVRWLAEERYTTIPISGVRAVLAGRGDAKGRVVALTFDDGYESHYSKVYPLLKEMGMTATFFVITEKIGRPGYLSWDELGEMVRGGMEVGCHSATHRDLTRTRSSATIDYEVSSPKAVLERKLGVSVGYFCYPSGKNSAALRERVKRAGYLGGVTTAPGWALVGGDPYLLRRVRVSRSDTMEAFKRKLEDPWIYGGSVR
jgi:peptidoglycan/xylan/chitin deacetylase (PgdA/CDA1 family)